MLSVLLRIHSEFSVTNRFLYTFLYRSTLINNALNSPYYTCILFFPAAVWPAEGYDHDPESEPTIELKNMPKLGCSKIISRLIWVRFMWICTNCNYIPPNDNVVFHSRLHTSIEWLYYLCYFLSFYLFN